MPGNQEIAQVSSYLTASNHHLLITGLQVLQPLQIFFKRIDGRLRQARYSRLTEFMTFMESLTDTLPPTDLDSLRYLHLPANLCLLPRQVP